MYLFFRQNKFARPCALGVLDHVKRSLAPWIIDFTREKAAPCGPLATKSNLSFTAGRPFGRPWADFSRFLEPFERHRKIMIFNIAPKLQKAATQSTQVSPRTDF